MSTRFFDEHQYAEMMMCFDTDIYGSLSKVLEAFTEVANCNWVAYVLRYPDAEEPEPVTRAFIERAFTTIRYRKAIKGAYGRTVSLDVLSDIMLLRYNCDELESAKEDEALRMIEHAGFHKAYGMLRMHAHAEQEKANKTQRTPCQS